MKRRLALLTLTLLLGGCGGMRIIDSRVEASAAAAGEPGIAAGAHYRFERLPSQSDADRVRAQQAAAEAALARVGLVHDEAAARYSVQLTVRMEPYVAHEWDEPGVHGSVMFGTGTVGSAVGMGMRFPPPTHYRHEVALQMRDLASGRIVYETRAVHQGPWNDQAQLLPALLEAALQGFPSPPAGPHVVKIEIPR